MAVRDILPVTSEDFDQTLAAIPPEAHAAPLAQDGVGSVDRSVPRCNGAGSAVVFRVGAKA